MKICDEMQKLRDGLDKLGIAWEDRSKDGYLPIERTWFYVCGFKWSVIHGYGSYGGWSVFSEDQGLLSQAYRDIFSPMELQVFLEKMQGYEYNEIAVHMGKTEKQIDNALQRIKRKLVEYLES